MVEIRGLTKRFGKFLALDQLDLDIEDGEMFGFVGPNGAGKTTTMKILSGLLPATSGAATVNGIDVLTKPEDIKRVIGYMPDFFGVYDNLKAMEYMEFYASMYGMRGPEATKHCQELMELVDLGDKADCYVDGLSRGMKQRLCLARCLVHDPQLLILDEPASGLDPRARFEMKGILKMLNKQGKTIIISSHILSELAEMCTTIGIIDQGKMILKGTVDEITHQFNMANPIEIQVMGELDKALRILKENPLVEDISVNSSALLVRFRGDEEAKVTLLKALVEQGVAVTSFARETGNLEELFMRITEKREVLSK